MRIRNTGTNIFFPIEDVEKRWEDKDQVHGVMLQY